MRRLIPVILVLSLLAGLTLTGCSSTNTIKIGVLSISSGPDAYVGQASELALKDRVAELNAAGGLHGRQVELVIYDTRGDVAEAVSAARRMIEQDKVAAIIGPSWSGAAIAIAPIADAARVPVIATTASNVLVTVNEKGELNPYMFRVCFIDPYQGYVLADFAARELGKKSAAFITDITSPYSVAIQQYFADQFTAQGGQVVDEEAYQANETEFRPQLSKVADSGAEVLLVPSATYRDIALVAKQAAALGLKIQYLGVDGWMADELLATSGPELEGAYLASGISTESPEFAEYNAAFLAKHNVKASVYAYYSLDALMALEYAVKQAGTDISGPALRTALEGMRDVQVFTSKLTMEPETHNPHNKPAVILQIHNSQWVIVKTYEPQ
ncbi:MAG: ABC transporter substrate-binding protein [Anaerolineae bacterium]